MLRISTKKLSGLIHLSPQSGSYIPALQHTILYFYDRISFTLCQYNPISLQCSTKTKTCSILLFTCHLSFSLSELPSINILTSPNLPARCKAVTKSRLQALSNIQEKSVAFLSFFLLCFFPYHTHLPHLFDLVLFFSLFLLNPRKFLSLFFFCSPIAPATLWIFINSSGGNMCDTT